MRNILAWIWRLGRGVWNFDPRGRVSYSFEGEDLVLARILDEIGQAKGFFVDIGAHHPVRFSNTNYFYRRGWRGINVDPIPGTKALFRRKRPRDITLECGVGAQSGMLKYYMFNEPALNTFSEQEAGKKDAHPYHIIGTLEVPIRTLKEILDEHLPSGTKIAFMNIDAEGFDQEIVSSNDWGKYRPGVILVEILNAEIEQLESNPTARLLKNNGYWLMAKTFNTFFFVDKNVFTHKTA